MDSKLYPCLGCGCHITKADRRSMMTKSMQLSVATRLLPTRVAKGSYICNTLTLSRLVNLLPGSLRAKMIDLRFSFSRYI